ncbi:hypothetical protein FO519_008872 [Halicephalobus sp. NKZ332]|nr:hypothetical protein FO519_008872 [Halicephalobus sp. NKZ332]
MLLKYFLLLLFSTLASSVNILIFLIGTNQFERHSFEFLAQQLALRHHTVVTVKPVLIPEEPRLVKPKLHLVKEKALKNLLPSKLYKPLENVGGDVPWRENYEIDAFDEPYWAAHNYSCEKILNSNLMDSLKKDKIDVALVYSGNPCQLALMHVMGVPFIYVDLQGFTDETVIASSSPWNLDSFSTRRSPSLTRINFGSRLLNGYHLIKESIVQNSIPAISRILSRRYRELDEPITRNFAEDYEIKKKFKSFPDVNKIKQTAELYFVNTDPILEDGTAFATNVVPIGGFHVDHVKPLFSPWNTTIAAAEEGMIIVSLGTQADSTKMKPSHFQAILGALSKLTKYRIYWRVGPNMSEMKDLNLDKIPSHINMTTFVPQNDLLGHKRCRLLITNGGMSSIMEAVAHGVPMVGIPLYGVNYANLMKVQNKGLGLVVQKNMLTENNLLGAIKEVLENKRFETFAKDASKEFKDRSESPFDKVLHMIEHIGRNRGGKFFRPSRQMVSTTWTRGNNLDFWIICGFFSFIFVLFLQSVLGILFRLTKKGPLPGSAGIEIQKQKEAKQESKKTK